MVHHHFDYRHVAEIREKRVPYKKVEEFVDPSSGDVIVDIGAGDGFYSINFAKKVGTGKVIAVEIDERGTDLIKEGIEKSGLSNIDIVQQNACDDFPFKGYNKVFFSNTFHDLPCRGDVLTNITRNSGSNLQVILIEFKKENQDSGPPMELRISEEELKEEFVKFGFKFSGRLELSHHYLHRYVKE